MIEAIASLSFLMFCMETCMAATLTLALEPIASFCFIEELASAELVSFCCTMAVISSREALVSSREAAISEAISATVWEVLAVAWASSEIRSALSSRSRTMVLMDRTSICTTKKANRPTTTRETAPPTIKNRPNIFTSAMAFSLVISCPPRSSSTAALVLCIRL